MLTAANLGSGARLFRLAAFLALSGNLPAQPDSKPPARAEETVALPTVSVTGDKKPWRYASLPRFEILTRASDERTYGLLLCYLRSWLVEGAVIPREWLRESPLPYTIIIDDSDPVVVGPSVTAPLLSRARVSDAFGWTLSGWGYPQDLAQRVAPLTGCIHAADDDTTVLGANLHGDLPSNIAPTWLDRTQRCVPGLPAWVMAGLVGRFGLFEDGINPVLMFVVFTSNDFTAPRDAAIFRGIRWVSTADTRRWLREGTAEIPFIPLEEFFSERPPPPGKEALWESQAGLMVRWGLLGTNRRVDHARRARFVKFVERQRGEAVTEKMLIECFDKGYAALENELKSYLRKTLGGEIQFTMSNIPLGFTQKADFSPATPDQVGRIIGDWQRIQGVSLRDKEPARAKEFLAAADRTLSRAWLRNSEWLPAPGDGAGKGSLAAIITASQISAAGNPDPDFLAVCGLYEHDIGNDKLAREVLEIAVSLHTRRPKAYLVLAELRAREAEAKPAGKDGTLSVAQATYVLQALKPALPPASTSRPWRLMVDTLNRCESMPSPTNLETVINGAALFPRDAALQLETARLCRKSGQRERAMDVINKALPLVVDEKVRGEFELLRDSIR